MQKSPKILLSLVLLAGLGLSLPAHGKSHMSKAVKPFNKIEEATISAISDTSITTTHKKDKLAATEKHAKPTVTKTYKITFFTEIQVDGKKATVKDLHSGMAVTISADPPSGVSEVNGSDGGDARTILAHDAPPK